jgi:hypothetical protein
MAGSKNDFCMVLPSNSNIKEQPMNRPDNYTVNLASKIELTGDWEVALQNIYYPHNWFDLHRSSEVYWIYTKRRVRDDGEILGKLVMSYDATFKSSTLYLASDVPNYPGDFGHTSFTMFPSNYASPQEIGDEMCRAVEAGIARRNLDVTNKVIFQYDVETRTSAVHTAEGTLYLFTESPYLGDALGINSTKVNVQRSDATVSRDIPKVYRLYGPKQSTFNKIDSIYVYADIAENQHVGDELSPLLGIVPVPRRTQEVQFFTFNPPIYLPVSKKEFKQVSIKLATSQNKSIPFPSYTSEVACTLRFRKRKNDCYF